MVHMVHVDTAQSKLSSANWSACPSRPERSTFTGLAATRSPASFQPRSEGSIAATRLTAAG